MNSFTLSSTIENPVKVDSAALIGVSVDSFSIEIEADLARIRFDSLPDHNGLTQENIPQIAATIHALGQRPDIKAIIIAGNEQVFCSGAAMRLLTHMGQSSLEERRAIFEGGQNIVRAIKSCGALVVGELEGLAAGAGVDLAFACDYLYAIPTCRVSWTFAKMSMIPDLGGFLLLSDKIGHGAALKFFLGNATWRQEDLVSQQIATTLTQKPIALKDWRALLRKELNVEKSVIRHIKQTSWAVLQARYDAHVVDTNARVCAMLDTEHHKEMVARTAALQKTFAKAQ